MPDWDVGIDGRLQRIRENRATRIPSETRIASRRGGQFDDATQNVAIQSARAKRAVLATVFVAVAILSASSLAAVRNVTDAGEIRVFPTREKSSGIDSLFVSEWVGAANILNPATSSAAGLLPPAPSGWTRLTHLEASAPRPLATLNSGWPSQNLPRVRPLTANLGYANLLSFISVYSQIESKETSLTSPQVAAIYLSHGGAFLQFQIISHPPLGPKDDRRSWLHSLEVAARSRLGHPEVMQMQRLSDFEFLDLNRIDQTQPHQNRARESANDPMSVALVTPLTNRVSLKIDGLARTEEVETLLAPMNGAEMAAAFR